MENDGRINGEVVTQRILTTLFLIWKYKIDNDLIPLPPEPYFTHDFIFDNLPNFNEQLVRMASPEIVRYKYLELFYKMECPSCSTEILEEEKGITSSETLLSLVNEGVECSFCGSNCKWNSDNGEYLFKLPAYYISRNKPETQLDKDNKGFMKWVKDWFVRS